MPDLLLVLIERALLYIDLSEAGCYLVSLALEGNLGFLKQAILPLVRLHRHLEQGLELIDNFFLLRNLGF